MRHRKQGRKLGRTSAHRKALFRNQLTALFTHERIITTVAKAKELRPLAERMVSLARTGTLPARRKVLTMVPDKETVARLFDDIAPRFMDRPGGYTRIMRLGRRRGDGAQLAIIEFVDYELSEKGDDRGGGKASLMDRAKGMFGGGAKAASEEAAVEEAEVEAAAEETEAEAAPAEEAPVEEPEAEAEEAVEEPEAEAEAPTEEPEAAAEEAEEEKKDE
jgi:large subunit ribosomal protein L17